MKTSELTNEIDAALSLFQGEMPTVKKDVNVKMNGVSKTGKEFNVNYDYAPLESIQELARPLLMKHGLNITQHLGFEIIQNNMIHLLTTRVGHKSGQWIMSVWPIEMSGVTKEQDRGSKITYNKRYAFAAALNIALSDEDNDAVDVQVKPQVQTKAPTQAKTQAQRPDLTQNYGEFVFEVGSAQVKGKKLKDLSPNDIAQTIVYFQNKAKLENKEINGMLRDQLTVAHNYLKQIGHA